MPLKCHVHFTSIKVKGWGGGGEPGGRNPLLGDLAARGPPVRGAWLPDSCPPCPPSALGGFSASSWSHGDQTGLLGVPVSWA